MAAVGGRERAPGWFKYIVGDRWRWHLVVGYTQPVQDLKDRVAVVTGAASGIGRALSLELARAGMNVALADRDMEGMESLAEEIRATGRRAICAFTDVNDPVLLQAVLDRTLSELGGCHLMANNAGVMHAASLLDTSIEQYRRVINTNLYGVIWGSRVFGAYFRAQGEGHVLNTCSGAGLFPIPGMGSYSTTKFAVLGFTLQLRWELASAGVGVTALCPGTVRTGITRAQGANLEHVDMNEVLRKAPPPEPLARKAVAAVRRNRALVRFGPEAYIFSLIRILPLWLTDPLGRFMARHALEFVKQADSDSPS